MQLDQQLQVSLLDLGYGIQINEAEIAKKLPLLPKIDKKQRSGCLTCLIIIVGLIGLAVTFFGIIGLSAFLPGLTVDRSELAFPYEFIVQAVVFYIGVILFFPVLGLFFLARSVRKGNEVKNAAKKREAEFARLKEEAVAEGQRNSIKTFLVYGDKDDSYLLTQ